MPQPDPQGCRRVLQEDNTDQGAASRNHPAITQLKGVFSRAISLGPTLFEILETTEPAGNLRWISWGLGYG